MLILPAIPAENVLSFSFPSDLDTEWLGLDIAAMLDLSKECPLRFLHIMDRLPLLFISQHFLNPKTHFFDNRSPSRIILWIIRSGLTIQSVFHK